MRPSGRHNSQLRTIKFELDISKHAEGSCLIKFGDTHVLCTATIENHAPPWMRGSGRGWVTAEYGMLPRATNSRTNREAARGKQSGRTQEIQRLIGRSLRAITKTDGFGEAQIKIDCDVLQADGGTRTAAITGSYIALYQAFYTMQLQGTIDSIPITEPVAAISCGIYKSEPILDLDYDEDSNAQADANFVLTKSQNIVEIQGTAEQSPFSRSEFTQLLELAYKGCSELIGMQDTIIKKISNNS